MDLVLLIARLGLAAVFGIAALAKLADRPATRASLAAFGVPSALTGPGSIAVPAVELAVAALLVLEATARLGALAALVVLLAFSAAIAQAMARGAQPDCNCFGGLHSAPAGPGALARNVILGAIAATIAVAGPGESVGTAFAGASSAAVIGVAALACVIVIQGWFSYQLFRQNGRLLERVKRLEAMIAEHGHTSSGLPENAPAPAFELPDIEGRHRSLDDLLAAGKPLALAFSDPDCAACRALPGQLARERAKRGGALQVAMVTRGEPADARTALNGYRLDGVLLQGGSEVAKAYRAQGVPSAVVIGPDGRIASPLATGEAAIEGLLG